MDHDAMLELIAHRYRRAGRMLPRGWVLAVCLHEEAVHLDRWFVMARSADGAQLLHRGLDDYAVSYGYVSSRSPVLPTVEAAIGYWELTRG